MLRARIGFHVDEIEKIVTVRYVGQIDGERAVPEVLTAFRALSQPWDYDCIWDLSRHEGKVEIRDNDALALEWQSLCGGRDAGRMTAVVSLDPLIDVRLPLTQRLFPFRTIALFGTVAAARVWMQSARAEAVVGVSAA